MSFFDKDTTVSRSLLEYGEWAQAEIDFLTGLLKQGDSAVDVGAFIGTHSLAFARRVTENGRVYSFEPQPLFFEVLKKNIEQNALTNVHLFEAALSDRVASAAIQRQDIDDASNFAGAALETQTTGTDGTPTEITTLDSIDIPSCALLKIDAEGMEIEVLRGALGMLRRTRPIVSAECNSLESGWPVVEFSRNEKFSVFLLSYLAFNQDNFCHKSQNFFGEFREASLILVPQERNPDLSQFVIPNRFSYLIPIHSADDLALALLKKPQYKYEVMYNTAAAKVLGNDFWGNELDVKQFRDQIGDSKSQVTFLREAHEQALTNLGRKIEEVASVVASNERLRIDNTRISREFADARAEYDKLRLALEKKIESLQNVCDAEHTERQALDGILEQIYRSRGWRCLALYYRFRERLLPDGSSRRRIFGVVARWIRKPWRFARHLTFARDAKIIRESGLFDHAWYLRQNADVAKAGLDPLDHYMRYGYIEGRNPSPSFDSAAYIRRNPDVARSALNPLTHYLRSGSPGPKDGTAIAKTSRNSRDRRAQFSVNPDSGTLPTLEIRSSVYTRPDGTVTNPILRPNKLRSRPPNPQLRNNFGASSDICRARRGSLLCVSNVLPYPPRAGNEYRIHRLLQWFAKQGTEVLLLVCPLPDYEVATERLEQMCSAYPNFAVCERDGHLWYQVDKGVADLEVLAGKKPRDFAKLLKEDQESSGVPQRLLPILRTFCPDPLMEVFSRLNEDFRPETVLVEYVFMTRVLQLLGPSYFKIIDTHDVFSSKHEKVIGFGVEDALALANHEEAALLEKADLLIAIQSEEARQLAKMVPERQVVTAGIDFSPVGNSDIRCEKPVIICVGSANGLNIKGLQDFVRFAWPIVKREIPQAELRVIGSVGKHVEVDDPSVRILGSVDDLEGEYAQARVVINPTVAGTGLKIKTVEAICHLRPIVTWPSGADGLGIELRSLCTIATNWYEFSLHVIDLLRVGTSDDEKARREQIVQHLSPEAVYRDLALALDLPRSAESSHRNIESCQ